MTVLLTSIALIAAACGSDPTETAEAADPTTETEAESEPEPEVGVRAGDVIVGEVELDLLNPIVTLTAEDPWNVADGSGSGAVILSDPDQIARFTRGVLLLEARPFNQEESIDDWAETFDGVTIESRSETQVGGLDAIVYDISYDGASELGILTAKCCGGRIVVRNTESIRLWMVETGQFLPLAIFTVVLKTDTDWLDKADRLVATMEIAS